MTGGTCTHVPPVILGQFLLQPRWCSSEFPYSAPGPRWGLPSPDPWFVPLSKFLATPLCAVNANATCDMMQLSKRYNTNVSWHIHPLALTPDARRRP